MLFRLGKLVYLALFIFVVLIWAQWQTDSGEVLHRSWDVTRQKFAQGASFADDMLDQAYFHNEAPSVSSSLLSSASATALPVSSPIIPADSKPVDSKPTDLKSINNNKPITPSPYAYVFYATEDNYACSVLVNIQRLQEVLHTRHRIFVLVSREVSAEYVQAFERRNATVSIQTPPPLAEGSAPYYSSCLLKLLAFKMHHIDPSLKKVISMDSDQLVLQNLDHLFESTVEVDLAAPRAYWIAKDSISSTFMLINLSERLWNTVDHAIKTIGYDKYDMDLVYDLFGETVMMLPGSFVTPNSHWEDWNLPKWFHSKAAANTTQDAKPTNESSQEVHQPPVSPVERRHLQVRQAPQQSLSSAHSKKGAEEEQTNASSGDIFKYLDEPIKPTASKESGVTTRSLDDPLSPPLASVEASRNSLVTEEHAEMSTEETSGLDRASKSSDDSPLPMQQEVEPVPTSVQEEQMQEQEQEQPLKYQHPTLAELQKQPLFKDLYELGTVAPVLHFFALGKPWTYSLDEVVAQRPGAHPLFMEQFRMWRETALRICPAGVLTAI